MPSREPLLPANIARGHEYTLVLDLDETLVHFDPVRHSFVNITFRKFELTDQDLVL